MAKLKDSVQNSIRSMLYNNKLRVGDNLSDYVLSRRLGVSRTPVRHAIQKLVNDGIAGYKAGIGYYVRCPAREEIEEIYELRELFECYAVGKAALKADKATIDHLKRICRQELQILKVMRHEKDRTRDSRYGKEFLCTDMDFHRFVVEAMGSHRVLKIIGELSLIATSLGHVWKDTEGDYWKTAVNSYKFHCRILRAIERCDQLAAEHAMREHISRGKLFALCVYDQRHEEYAAKMKNMSAKNTAKADWKHRHEANMPWEQQLQIIK